MKKEFYYLTAGMIYGIGLTTLTNSFYPFATDFPSVVASLIFVVLGMSLWHYDDEIKKRVGITE